VNSLNIATLGLLSRGLKPTLNIAAIGLLQFNQAMQGGGVASARPGFGAPETGRGINPETIRSALENFERIALPESERQSTQEASRNVSHETLSRPKTTSASRNNRQGGMVKRWH
jgi:hypothetical protein